MRRLLAGGAALLALAPMGAMAETPQKDQPGLLETVGTATAGALGGAAGSVMGPVGTAVGGIVGQQVGKGAIGLGKRMLGRDDKPAPDAATASADAAATLPQTLIPDPPPLAVPPPPEPGVDQAAAAPVEILPER